MKNFILPFVVVALFALGSCDDNPVRPIEKISADTNFIKTLKEVSIAQLPFLMLVTDFKTGKTSEQEHEYYRYSPEYTENRQYMRDNKPAGFDTVRPVSVNNNKYTFSWTGDWYHDDLTFTLDTLSRHLREIQYHSTYRNPYRQDEFSMRIPDAGYQIYNGELVVRLSKAAFEDGLSSAERHYFHLDSNNTDAGDFNSIKLLPFTSTTTVTLAFKLDNY
ncbi:MAG: hypothetical protein V4642_09955 [Bacteroidota bacterium]